MTNRIDEHETMAHHNLWKSGYNHGIIESERMIRDLQDALREEKELRQADNERFTNLLYPCGNPAAWKFKIDPYCGRGYCSGVVLSKDDLSPYIPKDKITWTALYEHK